VTNTKVEESLGRLSVLRRFPVNPHALAAIAEDLRSLCSDDGEADRLVAAILGRFDMWPGPAAIRDIHRAEIAPQRPRELEPSGCDKCRGRGGWRAVFVVTEQLADGSIKRETVYPTGNIMQAEVEIEQHYAGSKTHRVDTAMVAPCDCPRGMLRREELRQRDAQRQRQ